MRLVILLLLAPFAVSAQLTYYIRSDSVKLMKSGGNNELILQNGTRSVSGVLTNVGNGLTRFIDPRKAGDTLFIGVDTLLGFNSGQRFGVSGEDNSGTTNRSFDGNKFGFTLTDLNSYTVSSSGGSTDSATFRIQINRALEKHFLSEYTEPNGVREAKVELGTDDPENVYIINSVQSRGVTVASTILESADSIMTIESYKLQLLVDSSDAPLKGIRIPNLRTAPNTTGMQMLVRDSMGGKLYRMAIPSGGGGVTDHGALTGLGDDDHTQYALLAGRASGQTLIGGTAATDDLVLQSTSGVGATGALIQFKVGNNGGTTAMTVLNNGNVGIGNTNPSNLFHVAGSVAIGTTEFTGYTLNIFATSAAYMSLNTGVSGTGGSDGFQFGHEATGNYLIGREAVPTYFYTNNSAKMIIESAGNVGIGDMSPASLLTVGASDAFQVNSSGKLARYAASAITDGQMLFGHTANGTFEKGSLTGGTGITVTNSAGGATIAVNSGFVTSSFRTPTATNDANVDASTPGEEQYQRIGDIVHVWGTIEIDATASNTTTTFFLDFPFASAITSQTMVTGGQITAQTTTGTIGVGYVIASVANDNALFNLTPSGTGNITYSYSYSYRIVLP